MVKEKMADFQLLDIEPIVTAFNRSMEEVVRWQQNMDHTITIMFNDGSAIAIAVHKPVLH